MKIDPRAALSDGAKRSRFSSHLARPRPPGSPPAAALRRGAAVTDAARARDTRLAAGRRKSEAVEELLAASARRSAGFDRALERPLAGKRTHPPLRASAGTDDAPAAPAAPPVAFPPAAAEVTPRAAERAAVSAACALVERVQALTVPGAPALHITLGERAAAASIEVSRRTDGKLVVVIAARRSARAQLGRQADSLRRALLGRGLGIHSLVVR